MPKEKSIEYRDGEYAVRIVVRKATISDGIQRSLMVVAARREQPIGDDPDPRELTKRVLAAMTYPTCVSATVLIENLDGAETPLNFPISIEDFSNLPDRLVIRWENAVSEMNPHWVPGANLEEEEADAAGEAAEPS